jgi:hypothetical protein
MKHFWTVETRNSYRTLVGKLLPKRPLDDSEGDIFENSFGLVIFMETFKGNTSSL